MNDLITGGAGFIGTRWAKWLIARGLLGGEDRR